MFGCQKSFHDFSNLTRFWQCRKTPIFNLEKFCGASEVRQNRVAFFPKRVTILPSIGLEKFCSSDCFS